MVGIRRLLIRLDQLICLIKDSSGSRAKEASPAELKTKKALQSFYPKSRDR
jgi:hypothetical protein